MLILLRFSGIGDEVPVLKRALSLAEKVRFRIVGSRTASDNFPAPEDQHDFDPISPRPDI